jgi:hypothetical protein
MADSPRWCAHCNAYGDHHSDRCPSRPRDPLAFIMAAEEAPELMEADEYAEGMVGLINSRIIHSLQGSWQRAAQSMIESGVIQMTQDSWEVNYDELERVLDHA